jgi:hypothetical protein
MAASGSSPIERNWKWVPIGIVSDTFVDVDDLAAAVLLAPHLAVAAEEVPDLLDSAVRHCGCRFAWRQLEMRHTATLKARQEPDV